MSTGAASAGSPVGDAFYTPPIPLPDGAPGDLIRARPLDNPAAAVPGGENWLVLHRSEGADGTPVATSGIIALPDRTAHPVPAGGYPLVSWAHGTVGAADRCAPSRDRGDTGASPMNAYPLTLLGHFLDQGWAVAMTDYEALGTGAEQHLHPYLCGRSEAMGVLDIVTAARRLFPGEIGERFAIVGHSQGGQAALFAAHHAPGRVEGLVGVAAIAPANHLLGLVRAGSLLGQENSGFAFTPLFLAGALGGDPTIDPEQVLSPRAYEQLWPHVRQRSRAGLSRPDSWGGIKGTEQFRPGYPHTPNPHQEKFDRQVEAMNPDLAITVPVRIVQAADDERVRADPAPLLGTDGLVEELTATNSERGNIHYRRYEPGAVPADEPLGIHFATIGHDTPELTGWLAALLADDAADG
ncbi:MULTISPECIES: alpha/beta hydrolase family protein [unclassified Streptomyces]|uniref:alpha/beta hydrolase family protein n=1 Tax=unclassified Streptomyces TaxID=2593676 RepID=UPI00081D65A2|nr:lipase family protein [Streptomyces sp. ScaeMP-e83]MYR93268.1 lipase [Streptomyces sp. SID4937]SCD49500.1 Secretory lipase [Streptomyces sp. ScaeMP-e83]